MNQITGRCLCGKITLEYDGTLGPAGYCHCDDCRRCTGGAYTLSVRMDRDKLKMENEETLGVYTSTGDSGGEISRLFCKECGSPIMTVMPTIPQFVWVKAGIIDQTQAIQPAHESWITHRVPWADIRVEKRFEKNSKHTDKE